MNLVMKYKLLSLLPFGYSKKISKFAVKNKSELSTCRATDKIDKKHQFYRKEAKEIFFVKRLQIAQVLAKADALVIIMSA